MFKDGQVKQTRFPAVDTAVYKTKDYAIGAPLNKQIKMRYLGCGGFYIANSSDAVLIDPFFSNTGFLKVGLSKMKTSPSNVDYGLEGLMEDIKNKARGIFVTHSHYDHLLDVPYVYNHFTNKAHTKIYVSPSGAARMAHVVDASHIVNIQSNPVSNSREMGKQYPLGADSSIWVTPILSEHAPHYKKISLYNGDSQSDTNYNSDTTLTWASQWRLGDTYAYLIDFKGENHTIEYRIFVMSSAAPPKYSWLPEDLLSEHPVNLAILGAASFEYVANYPEGIVDHLNPEKIIICHWEDFFRDYQSKTKRIVRFTNVKKFINRLNKVYPYTLNGVQQFSMPNPITNIIINY